MTHASPPRTVVIVGAGFGGLEAAQRIARAGAHTGIRVIVLDRSNHHLFQPLLYQVATAVLSPADIAFPIRRVFRRRANVLVFRAEIARVELVRRAIVHSDGTETHYDWLVLAAGAGQSYFGRDEWGSFSLGMKTVEDASRIRGRMLQAFEDAEAESDTEALRAHLTFVIVGGGPTGVELAGAIKELTVDAMDPDFRRFDAANARVILVEAQDRLLGAMSTESSQNAKDALERIGVEVRLRTSVTDIDERGVTLQMEGRDGEMENGTIRADTVLWAAGVEASPIGRTLGVGCDRAGRVEVGPDLSVPGYPEAFVIGDMASATCARTGGRVPGLCPAAAQMGRFVGDLIVREARGTSGPRPSFTFRDKGELATIGRAKAVADLRGRHFSGLFAWLLWCFVHVFFLIGFRNRLFVMLSWGITYLLYSKGSRIILGNPRNRVELRVGDPR
ncbi:MAG: NAD(P)/FAD-dependent oxidoreductase [Phycisphaerae bacterium]|nr:NAD(P)/FAD-dependent oxidoreductase [Phycisphaerae bacterium]